MTFYRAKDNTVVDEEGRQVAVILPVACTKKLAREMAAYAAQQANHDAQRKERESRRRNDEWQPIETAPRDGTEVLLYGLWAGEIHGPAEAGSEPTIDIGSWHGGGSDYPGNDWWTLSTGDAYACWMRPTHWMPLPPLPSL